MAKIQSREVVAISAGLVASPPAGNRLALVGTPRYEASAVVPYRESRESELVSSACSRVVASSRIDGWNPRIARSTDPR
jgi:hypothetical protein